MPTAPNTPERTDAGYVPLLSKSPSATSSSHARIARRQVAAHLVLAWAIAYLVLRFSSDMGTAAEQALLVSVVWLAIWHRVAQAFRVMAFAVGPFALAITTSVFGALTISALGFWVPSLGFESGSLVLVALATAAGVGLWDYVASRASTAPRRILVVGAGEPTSRLLDDLDRESASGLTVVAIVGDEQSTGAAGALHVAPLANLESVVRSFRPDLVVVAVPTGRPAVFAQLLEVADSGFQVVGLPEIYEVAFGRLPVSDLTSAWFMSVLHAYQRPSNRLAKRTFDIVVAVFGLLIALPLLPAIIVVVRRTKGPLLYRQRRLGEHGREFTMLKFRSMRVDAEASGEALWASTNDPRVIPGGRFLRLLRLDELPQLWNVVKGEMSIVGPRPERPEFVRLLRSEVPFWTQRHLLKPGITGWAQIRSGYAADALGAVEKLSYDLWYLRHRNILLDATICLKTLPRMAMFRGAR
jgi:exopolysaccharide biosynthesis polyprenyl glycosylphosphotransferase